MVRRKRIYAESSKKKKKPRYTYSKPSSGLSSAVSRTKGIGNRVDSNFIYFDTFSLDVPAGGAAQSYLFRINSLFDPDFALGGHQPGGFDELMAIYEHYCVTMCEYKVIYQNTNVAALPALIAVQVSDNSTTSTNFGTFIENGNAQHTMVSATNGSPIRTLTGTVDIAKLMGVSRSTLLKDDSFWGSQGTNPSDVAFLKIIVGSIPSGDDGPSVNISVELKFTSVLMGGRFVVQS